MSIQECAPNLDQPYTRIANNIIEAIAVRRIPQEPMSCIFVVLRKTYGYRRKEWPITLSEFCQRTGMRKPNVSRAIKWLIDRKIIIRRKNGVGMIYSFNKHYEQWEALSRRITQTVISTDNEDDKSLSLQITSLSPQITNVISTDNPIIIKETLKKEYKEKAFHGSKLSQEITIEIYKLYNKTINPIRKSAVRAKTNIAHHLKNYPPEHLKQAITNYNTIKPDGPEYRKDPANFFGKTEPYFVDYLPGNFDAPREDEDDRFRNLR